jgi:hypothetical protein
MSVWTRIDLYGCPAILFALACMAAWFREPLQMGLAFLLGSILMIGLGYQPSGGADA